MALPKTDFVNSGAPARDPHWYQVEEGPSREELADLAKRLEFLYPGRYETRVSETPDVSHWKLSVRHMG